MDLVQSKSGWDEIVVPATSASQTGVGSTLSAERVVSPPIELKRYIWFMSDKTFPTVYSRDAGVTGTVSLQAEIDGSWVTLLSMTVNDTTVNWGWFLSSFITGTLTKLRVKSEVTVGVGTLSGTYALTLQYIFGRLLGRYTTS